MWRKRVGLATEGRLPFVQPLSLTPFDSSPSRGASGETVHFAGTAKASPTRRGGTPSGVTERLYKGKPAHNQKKPPARCGTCRGLFVQSGGMRKLSALGVGLFSGSVRYGLHLSLIHI